MGKLEDRWTGLLEVLRKARVIKHPEKLRRDASFADQKIDSLDQASLLLAIEEAYGISLLADPRTRPLGFQEILEIIAVKEDAGHGSDSSQA